MIEEAVKEKIALQGRDPEKIEAQIVSFKNGFPFLAIDEPATIGNGIEEITEEQISAYEESYPSMTAEKELVKFVPASGAATRMFKNLFAYLESEDQSLEANPFVKTFISNLSSFAFYKDLKEKLSEKGKSIDVLLDSGDYATIITYLLSDEGLGYGKLPKGLLKFHNYEEGSRTPVYEHFIEGLQYGLGKNNTVRLHFTVSPEHQVRFEAKVNELKKTLTEKYGVNFDVTFSQQKPSTDTIAVNMDNTPFMEDNGEILFRPAGHGALLENLNEIDADLIFIKNIDNVVPDHLKETTKKFKIVIASILLETQEKLFGLLRKLHKDPNKEVINTAEAFLENDLGLRLSPQFNKLLDSEKIDFLKTKLNRPLRVCGMVENTGEPGGGPFWVKDKDGSFSLQIGETAQLDLNDSKTTKIFRSSSHFNPTDLVCGVKDYEGNKFDLLQYRDPETGFITQKSKNGKDLKAQELPGLWNGSMADWNSIFVEVPLATFNPVKTINDLLREQHQSS
ncbi:DUF4301 domain-containing protein [Echinicola strongylocentroti]|uniref:DUF4301 domain-containing protein n=1 Tax=Echinicola strongylocentroti TaxID=1795355 RepID=A0A2Z4INX7_9BACT|nr:DUF4301 family protein [Echinicola strongylocentroti]AWW32554.1 DUF4301 domain-containing protein [Echinicola strongylocentroti]